MLVCIMVFGMQVPEKKKKNDWSANNCKKCSAVLFFTQIHGTNLQIDKVM